MKFSLPLFLLFLVAQTSFAVDPEKKTGSANRVTKKPVLDGIPSEDIWKNAQILTGFTQLEPNNGQVASKNTTVKVVYDDDAIYVCAQMEDVSGDSVLRELTARDNIGNADWFAVLIDAYKDGNNGVGFIVTASGVQTDVKYSVFGEDETWNAVWQSNVNINEKGWTVEFKIPYSALRFPNQPEQQWHINFIRYSRMNREKASWNYINPAVNGFLNQSGLLNGIQGIEPPIRLQLFPYVSSYYNISGKEKATSFNGGMDVKYGLSDAFTLDMTLVPDFGQVQSDNQVLNLSPFEVRYQENRQFFTEGTELFNKGDLFYSRRIGEAPFDYYDVDSKLKTGEKVEKNPSDTRLINATKVSGRTTTGLGIGVFNAVTRNTFATVTNEAGAKREVLTGPATNFNVTVLDQNLPNNSYVTLINTNVSRNGSYYDANVTGVQFNLQDKNIKYGLSGFGAVSQKYETAGKQTYGSKHSLDFGKVSGNFTANIGYSMTSDRYDPNDMGFLLYNNTVEKYLNAKYNFYKPFGKFNRAGISGYITHTTIFKPDAFNNFGAGVDAFFILKSFHAFGGFFSTEPITTYDYFETRSNFQRYYTYPVNHNIGGWVSSDYRKRFAFDINANYRFFDEPGRTRVNCSISPRFRVNNKLSFIYTYSVSNWQNDVGYAVENNNWYNDYYSGNLNNPTNQIVFGIRDQYTYTNLLTTKYSFNNKMGLTFRLRHYWSKVKYDNVYGLTDDGMLGSTNYTGYDAKGNSYHDNSFNAFNIDMVYSYVFSPGSELRLVWKNSIYTSEDFIRQRYDDNLNFMFDQTQTNSFSLKFLYFLDYSMLRRRKV